MRQAVIYLRVSTIEQTTANQERELREIASRMGCEIVKVYLGRSLQDLVAFLSELHALKIDLFLRQQGLDSVFAEFERAMIQERVRAGLARARSEGKRLGSPCAGETNP